MNPGTQQHPHRCPICGHHGLDQPPRSPAGGGSFEICVCCGFQFGVDDDDRGLDPATARERWIAGGARWFSRSTPPPPGWDARRQLEAAGLAPTPGAPATGPKRDRGATPS